MGKNIKSIYQPKTIKCYLPLNSGSETLVLSMVVCFSDNPNHKWLATYTRK